jgi:hypothetical protein
MNGDFDRKTILINSQFRESGTSSQFSWRFKERIEGIRHAELRYFVLENGVYNVDTTNNRFYLSENGALSSGGWTYQYTNLSITIPEGYYDDTTLAETIGSVMTNVSSVSGSKYIYSVQFQSTGILSITNASSNLDFAIGFTDGTTPVPPTLPRKTASLLGFNNFTDQNAYNSLASGLFRTIVGSVPARLASFDYVLIQSQKLGNDIGFYSAGGGTPATSAILQPNAAGCFAFVPNYTPSQDNSTIIYENTRAPQISTLKFPYSLDYVDIAIVDKYGQTINLRNNNVHLVIELYTNKTSQTL